MTDIIHNGCGKRIEECECPDAPVIKMQGNIFRDRCKKCNEINKWTEKLNRLKELETLLAERDAKLEAIRGALVDGEYLQSRIQNILDK